MSKRLGTTPGEQRAGREGKQEKLGGISTSLMEVLAGIVSGLGATRTCGFLCQETLYKEAGHSIPPSEWGARRGPWRMREDQQFVLIF